MKRTLTAAAMILMLAGGSAVAQDTGDSVPAINAIIKDLKPAEPSAYEAPQYRAQIRTVEVPVSVTVEQAPSTTVQVVTETRTVVLNYNHSRDFRIHFVFDSADLTPDAKAMLNTLGQALLSPDLASARYLIGGHTDSVGPRDYNWFLSERRANAAKNYLVSTFGITPDRLVTVGFGEEFPAVAKQGAIAANRRVEVTLIEPAVAAPAPVATVITTPAPKPTTVVVTTPGAAVVTTPSPTTTVVETPAVTTPHASTGNVVCDTQSVALTDPRPATSGLDDFGSPRTPVSCGDQAVRQGDTGAVAGAIVSAPATDAVIQQLNSAIRE